ncbi:MAG: SDR family oxidoreductase [Actinomycetota bacterium]
MTAANDRGVVVVTGASRGIGFAVSRRLWTDGYDVIGVARTRPEQWGGGRFIEADLASSQGVQHVCDAIGELPSVWGLLNDAGRGLDQSLDDLDEADLAAVLHLNTVVPASLAAACARRMHDGGRIVNIGSVVALGAPNRTAYGASKAALASMTRTWALELATRGITVNTVAPGPIETELFRTYNPVGSERERAYLAQIPVRHFGQADDLAELIAMIMSPSMAYLTGQTIYFDGGFTVGRTAD